MEVNYSYKYENGEKVVGSINTDFLPRETDIIYIYKDDEEIELTVKFIYFDKDIDNKHIPTMVLK